MLFDDDEWLQCPDHRKLKAWKKQPGGGGCSISSKRLNAPIVGEMERPGRWDMVPLGLGLHGSGLVTGPRGSQSGL